MLKLVRAKLANGGLAPTFEKLRSSERQALKSFYDNDGAILLWVMRSGLTDGARTTMAEFGKANFYGLRSRDYAVSRAETENQTPVGLAEIELKLSAIALLYARHAKGGQATAHTLGSQLAFTPATVSPLNILVSLVNAPDRPAYLRSLHPQHRQFQMLRRKLAQLMQIGASGDLEKLPSGPALKKGMTHPHVANLRERLKYFGQNTKPPSDDRERFDTALDLAVKSFQRKQGLSADGVVGRRTRIALDGRNSNRLIAKIILNMERWRWLPDELGGTANIYVWANIPELRVRAVKEGKVVFSQKAIVGQVGHKTPVFSDEMEWIEIHPTWFIPASIKVSDILPSLRRPTSTVMGRYNLRVDCGRFGKNYKTIDWKNIDINKCNFTQPPGPKSVLGDFKFKFPNRHSVYMHDTHDRRLFSRSKRTFSHGCVRVKKPRLLAEVLLSHDKGLTSERVGEILAGPKVLHKEILERPVPVHLTYFTLMFDRDGKLQAFPDYYGHDRRLEAALSGGIKRPAKRRERKHKISAKSQTSGWGGALFSD
ncbi:MAG: L,D-transpeptidase family protein [Hyphomicrobiaceae bacterium]